MSGLAVFLTDVITRHRTCILFTDLHDRIRPDVQYIHFSVNIFRFCMAVKELCTWTVVMDSYIPDFFDSRDSDAFVGIFWEFL